jgi:hypothetical protein
MRKHWVLPDELQFRCSGTDWLLSILSSADSDIMAKILMLLWRAWHRRNDMIHEHGKSHGFGVGAVPYKLWQVAQPHRVKKSQLSWMRRAKGKFLKVSVE